MNSTYITAVLLFSLIACACKKEQTSEPIPAQFTAELCADTDTFHLQNNCALVNDQWNKEGVLNFEQCIFKTTTNGTTTSFGWNWTWPNNGRKHDSVKAYPHVLFGRNPWGTQSRNITELPRLVRDIVQLSVRYKAQPTYTALMNQYNLSFDIWLANSQNPYRANITTEIMIWEDKSLIFPYISPINLSPIVGNFTTGNITYDLVKYIHQDTPPWTYLAFIPRSAINTVDRTIDLMPFLNYLRANSHIVATDYLCNVSFGNEIIEGSGANTLTEFSVTLATTPSTDHFIVFDRSVAGHPDIFIANTDGTNVTNLTNNSADDFHPRLNPANDRVLFISNRSGQANVYIMNLDGSNVQQVTTGGVSGGQNNVWYRAFADFTSDSKIVYCKGNKLYKINVDGTNNIAIATAPSDNWERVSCSRAGNKIAALTMGSWSYNEKIYIMNPDGSNMQVLVPDNPGGIYLGTFSPDGSKIAYIYDISGHEESSGCQLNNHVFLINIDGTNNTDISGGKVSGTCDFYPAITDDGQKVIFSNGPGCGGGTSSPNIWMMNIDGSNRQQIITDGYVLDTN